jgi:hypothetical protein
VWSWRGLPSEAFAQESALTVSVPHPYPWFEGRLDLSAYSLLRRLKKKHLLSMYRMSTRNVHRVRQPLLGLTCCGSKTTGSTAEAVGLEARPGLAGQRLEDGLAVSASSGSLPVRLVAASGGASGDPREILLASGDRMMLGDGASRALLPDALMVLRERC